MYKCFSFFYNNEGYLGQGGTSNEAIKKISKWINQYASKQFFKMKCEMLNGSDVSLSKINDCLTNLGCVLVSVWLDSVEHYVIITKIKTNRVYIFDPYYLDKSKYKDKEIKIVSNKPFTHNRILLLNRLFSEDKKDFAIGEDNKRECLLMNRIV